jgi:ABC-type methionine transport system ATPase subunit
VTNPRVKLTFPEELVRQPIIGRLVREFDVLPNIRRASVEPHMGWMVCELGGDDADVEAAIAWLIGLGVAVDRMSDVVES